MFSNRYVNKNERRIFILLTQKLGTIREINSFVGKERIVNPGTLLKPASSVSESDNSDTYSEEIIQFQTCESNDILILLSCHISEVEELDFDLFLLLLPVHPLKERLNVYKNKDLLNDGRLFCVNDNITVNINEERKEIKGTIRYKGPVNGTKGTYFGIELKESKGNTDGMYNGQRYFKTSPDHAIFSPIDKIHKPREDRHRRHQPRSDRMNGGLHMDNRLDGTSTDIPCLESYKDLRIGDRVLWPSDEGLEAGTVRWIGILPDDVNKAVTIGVEFDNPVGTGTGKYKDRRLFHTNHRHASLIPPLGLMKADDASNTTRSPIVSSQEKILTECHRNKSLQPYGAAHQSQRIESNKSLPAQLNEPPPYASIVSAVPKHQPISSPGKASGAIPRQISDTSLTIGSLVEIPAKTGSLYGKIQWRGYTDASQTKETAGIELEQENPIGTDGTFKGKRFFDCLPGRAIFVPLARCVRDKRAASGGGYGSFSSPDVEGEIPVPELMSTSDLQLVCGKHRGIQGHHNSCYLDSTLFSMFYFSTVFDSIFNRPPRHDDLPEYMEVQKVLKEGIVNPLRRDKYVSSDKVHKLRVLLDKLGKIPGMMGEEKDVEEFLSALLTQIMRADYFLHLSTGEETYFYQLFVEKDENLVLPTTQKLVELSFLQGNVKLKKVPACLMIQMPRFGKDYKMFRRIVPSLELDITDILENSPRDCYVCGDIATWECKKCYQVHGQGLNATAYCDNCKDRSHQHGSRKSHNPQSISTQNYMSHFQNKKRERERRGQDPASMQLPRDKMELFAVICIQTSHYVSFVKCGPGINAPWVFFDSMADRIGEQGGFNVPEVVHVPNMASELSEKNLYKLNTDNDKELPEYIRRLLSDGYMCMYQHPDVMRYQ